jgi:hypothetical protein
MRNAETSFAILASVLYLSRGVTATQHGIVGFGINLYPDLCCQACHDSLATLPLNCTTFDEDGGGAGGMDMGDMKMGMTSDDCRASNSPWLQTMAHCIQEKCNAVGYAPEKQSECFSVQALGGASEPTFQNSLPSQVPTAELEADAMWLNETSLVNKDLYDSTYGTLGEFVREERLHSTYAYVLLHYCGSAACLYKVTPICNKCMD